MKIAFNLKPTSAASGGGFRFADSLVQLAARHGNQITDRLDEPDINAIIFQISGYSTFSIIDAYRYRLRHPHVPIFLRVNNSDQGRGTHSLNRLIIWTARFADHLIYISHWTQDLFVRELSSKPATVILNGGNHDVFNSVGHKPWSGHGPLSLVTHHWSTNPNKGHDIYRLLDSLIALHPKLFSFTYIGPAPASLKKSCPHTSFLNPLSGPALAAELKKHHVYLTAALNESAGMHHIEGALCGLLLLYRASGALPEYCRGFGLEFTDSNFPDQLFKLKEQYPLLQRQMSAYAHTADRMAQHYFSLIKEVSARFQASPLSLALLRRLLLPISLAWFRLRQLLAASFLWRKLNPIRQSLWRYYKFSFHRNLLEHLLEQNKNLLSGYLLDIGSKSRRYDHLFTGLVTAVDLNPNLNQNIAFGDLEAGLNFPDSFFDGLLCLEVLEYLHGPIEKPFKEIYRLLQSGAYALVSLPFLANAHGDRQRYTENHLAATLSQLEFSSVNIIPFGNGHTAIWDIMKRKLTLNRPVWQKKIIYFCLLLPWLLIIKLTGLDKVKDHYYSGLFLILKK